MKVNIIGKSNGVGLDRDARLLADALRACGCDVHSTVTGSRQSGWRKSMLGKMLHGVRRGLPAPVPVYDLNVMLEHVWTHHLHLAQRNVVVPNPDFFDRHDVAAVAEVDRVWAKTGVAAEVFQSLGGVVTRIGFDSDDRYLADVSRQRSCFHLAGSSQLKGTQRLLGIWARKPHWPLLTVVGRLKFDPPEAANIRVLQGYCEDAELRQLQNQSLIHVCTSEAEGWGHYIVEGLSVGAVVITLDAPPMNELVMNDRGVLLQCTVGGKHRLAQRHLFDEHSLSNTMDELAGMTDDALRLLGDAARRWFLDNKAGFHGRVKRALEELDV